MFRVLKPGAKLSFLDYVQLPAYDASDAKHHELLLKAQGFYGREPKGLVVFFWGGFSFLIEHVQDVQVYAVLFW